MKFIPSLYFRMVIIILSTYLTPVLCFAESLCELRWRSAKEIFERDQYLLSAIEFRQLQLSDCAEFKARADYGWMLSMYHLGETQEVLEVLNQYRLQNSGSSNRKFRLFESTLIMEDPEQLSGPEELKLRLWLSRDREKAWGPILKEQPGLKSAESFLKEIEKSRVYSVPLASSLSIFPGLGQFYTRSWSSAWIAFSVNALFGWAAYEFFDRKLYGAGAASSLVLSITYFGNIIQAGRIAQQKNENSSRPHESALREHLFPELLSP